MTSIPRNLDKIHIRDLSLRCIIGINEEERREKQDLLIGITCYAQLASACDSDRIEDSVNYKTTTKEIIALVENSDFYLIEKLAEEIARLCLMHPLIQVVKVTVDKPAALRFSRSVAVEIVRAKSHD